MYINVKRRVAARTPSARGPQESRFSEPVLKSRLAGVLRAQCLDAPVHRRGGLTKGRSAPSDGRSDPGGVWESAVPLVRFLIAYLLLRGR